MTCFGRTGKNEGEGVSPHRHCECLRHLPSTHSLVAQTSRGENFPTSSLEGSGGRLDGVVRADGRRTDGLKVCVHLRGHRRVRGVLSEGEKLDKSAGREALVHSGVVGGEEVGGEDRDAGGGKALRSDEEGRRGELGLEESSGRERGRNERWLTPTRQRAKGRQGTR